MALPRPRKERWRYDPAAAVHTRISSLCCCAAATDPGALLSPTPCSPQLPPRGQRAVTQSGFSVREAALPRSGMSNKITLYRALHGGRPEKRQKIQ